MRTIVLKIEPFPSEQIPDVLKEIADKEAEIEKLIIAK